MIVTSDGSPPSDARSRWRRLRDLILLHATWKRTAVSDQASGVRRRRRSHLRTTNRNAYHNEVIKRWANRRGRTASTAPIMTQTKRHYRQLFAMLDPEGSGCVHARDLVKAARQSQIELGRDQARAMISNYDDNHDDSVDFNEFQSLMDRDIRSLSNQELRGGHPLMFFMIAWQRRTMMSRLMTDMTLSLADLRILKQTRRLAAEVRDRDTADQAERYWRERVEKAQPDADDALLQISGAEQYAFRRLHEHLYKNGTWRRFRDPNRVTLLEAAHLEAARGSVRGRIDRIASSNSAQSVTPIWGTQMGRRSGRRPGSGPVPLGLPPSLIEEVARAAAVAEPVESGADLIRPTKRAGRSRKQARRQERLMKKQRRAQYNDRLCRKPIATITTIDSAVDDIVSGSDDSDVVPEPESIRANTKRRKTSLRNELDNEIEQLENKLGGDADKLRRELRDDGLLGLYETANNLLAATGVGTTSSVVLPELDSDEEAERAEQFRCKAEVRRRKQAQLYGPVAADDTPDAAAVAKYVPPALRESAGEVHVRKGLTRTVVGQLNRLSESNLETVLNAIKVLFDRHARGVLTDIISDAVLSMCRSFRTQTPVAVSLAGLVTGLNVEIGAELGALFCERLAHAFQATYDGAADAPTALNLARFIAHLHTFQMVSSALVYDLIRTFIAAFTELDIDLILALVSTCGAQLRRDDPGALMAIVLQIQAKTASAETVAGSSRSAFVLDLIYDLKNNRPRPVPGQLDALRAWLRHRFPDAARAQIRVGWHELLDSNKTGRWWLVGSAWKGRATTTFSGEKSATDHVQAIVDGAGPLLKLADARRMNTDVRRAVFCVVMGAADYLDAFDKLVRLALRPPMDKDVVSVLLDCCANEKVWNPYYGHLSAKLCSFQRSYKFTFQIGFGDLYKTLSTRTPRQVSNLAHLLAHLVVDFSISLAHVKVADLVSTRPTAVLFFMVLFKAVLNAPKDLLGGVFQRISATSRLEPTRDAIGLFLRSHFTGHGLDNEIDLAQRCMDRTDVLEAL